MCNISLPILIFSLLMLALSLYLCWHYLFTYVGTISLCVGTISLLTYVGTISLFIYVGTISLLTYVGTISLFTYVGTISLFTYVGTLSLSTFDSTTYELLLSKIL